MIKISLAELYDLLTLIEKFEDAYTTSLKDTKDQINEQIDIKESKNIEKD